MADDTRQHTNPTQAFSSFRAAFLEATKAGKWMAAVWRLDANGNPEIAGCTTWEFDLNKQDIVMSSLQGEINKMQIGPEVENDPLPPAPFLKVINETPAEEK